MNLKKLIPELVQGIKEAGFDEAPRQIQTASVPLIKSGADLFILSPEGTGKSTAILIGVIQHLKDEFEVAPRAIIMAATKDKAFELEEQFEVLAKRTNLRVFTVFDEGHIQYHKDMIYEGIDVLISTPVQLSKLVKQNGIRLSEVKLFVVDDADTLTAVQYPIMYQVAEGIPKSQFVMVANKWNKNFEKLEERFMKNPRIVKA